VLEREWKTKRLLRVQNQFSDAIICIKLLWVFRSKFQISIVTQRLRTHQENQVQQSRRTPSKAIHKPEKNWTSIYEESNSYQADTASKEWPYRRLRHWKSESAQPWHALGSIHKIKGTTDNVEDTVIDREEVTERLYRLAQTVKELSDIVGGIWHITKQINVQYPGLQEAVLFNNW
jgi:hypothetical protein